MFPHGYPLTTTSASMSWPRPFVVGFILLMLFLSLSNSPGDSREGGTPLQPSAAGGPAAATTTDADGLRKGVKEQIIYDLSLANERLEGEVQKLRQYVLDLRRAAREAGCELRDDSILTLYPELSNEIQGNGSGSGSEGKAASDEDSEAAAEEKEEEKEATAVKVDTESMNGAQPVPLGGSRRARIGGKVATAPPIDADDDTDA